MSGKEMGWLKGEVGTSMLIEEPSIGIPDRLSFSCLGCWLRKQPDGTGVVCPAVSFETRTSVAGVQ